MSSRILTFAIGLLVFSGTTCGAATKNLRSYDASIKYHDAGVEEDEADRGVLGVRYAVGVDLLRKTHVVVVNTVKNGPADEAHLQKGDRIVEINGTPVISLKAKQVGPLMRGEPGSTLELTVKRGLQTLHLSLVRGNLHQLPDSEFRNRVLESAIAHERDEKIASLAEALSAQYPDIAEAIRDDNYAMAATGLKHVTGNAPTGDGLLLYGLVLAKLGKLSDAVEVLKQAAPAIHDKKTEDLIHDVVMDLSSKTKK